MLQRIWADPVWSKVIATGICAALASIGVYFVGWWPPIQASLDAWWTLLGASTAVPNWLLAILSLCGLAVALLLGLLSWGAIFDKNAKAKPLYAEDVLFGIRWRWRYHSDGSIYHLTSFCPHCDLQVHPVDVAAYRIADHIQYRCEDCGTVLADFDIPYRAIEDRVIRQIQKKLRTVWLPSLEQT